MGAQDQRFKSSFPDYFKKAKEMILPKSPTDLKVILYDKFIKLMSGKLTDMDWSIFSGEFNRHCHKKKKKARRKEKLLFQYLFQVWLAMQAVYASRSSILKIFRRELSIKRLEDIKTLFEELLKKYEAGASYDEMTAMDNPVILKELEEIFNKLKQGKEYD